MPPKKAARKKSAGKKRPARRKPRAVAPARPSRKQVSAARAARAVGTLAILGTAIAAEKIKQTVARGKRLAGSHPLATTAGKAALAAGVSAAVAATAEELARRGNR